MVLHISDEDSRVGDTSPFQALSQAIVEERGWSQSVPPVRSQKDRSKLLDYIHP